ncbi:peptidoglycan bridge formation glycyltransferase FemA/FemB family protein, partial [Candidatus Uhrbacteria bacterium]|nr:peptidoglycan bridge formation glycyltransferase FemA/FemB family protein [Candidatus Uhrbacteria bacterium]
EEVSAAFLKNRRFVKSQKNIQPVKTLVLDLAENEDELLVRMHPKTRYNIRLAQKRGVRIVHFSYLEEEQFERVFELLKDTARRQGFSLHLRGYYRKMIDVLGRHGLLQVYLAFFKGEIVAVNFIVFYGDRAVYLHGASDYRHKNLMATHQLHWRVIKEAKERGFREYDLWGVSEKYAGVSRFKRSFGGREIEYPGSFDLVFNPLWYNMYKIGSKLSRLVGRN